MLYYSYCSITADLCGAIGSVSAFYLEASGSNPGLAMPFLLSTKIVVHLILLSNK